MTKYIIIGNGVAANSAAESIRKNDPASSIIMFSREKYPFYIVPALPDFLSGTKDIPGITIHNEQWYSSNSIELYLNTPIAEINPSKKNVTTNTGSIYPYDKLLLATGGYSFIPPIKGSDSEGVFGLRTIADALSIKQKAAA